LYGFEPGGACVELDGCLYGFGWILVF